MGPFFQDAHMEPLTSQKISDKKIHSIMGDPSWNLMLKAGFNTPNWNTPRATFTKRQFEGFLS